MTRRLSSLTKPMHVSASYDDDTTVVRIWEDDGYGMAVAAEGTAHRKKGDPRNSTLGLALATGRAFEALAKREFAYADRVLNPPEPEEGVVSKAFREMLKGFSLAGEPEAPAEPEADAEG